MLLRRRVRHIDLSCVYFNRRSKNATCPREREEKPARKHTYVLGYRVHLLDGILLFTAHAQLEEHLENRERRQELRTKAVST